MLDNNSKEENDVTKISESSMNQSKNSNGLTIMTKTQRGIHHLVINKKDEEIKNTLILYVLICSHHGNLNLSYAEDRPA